MSALRAALAAVETARAAARDADALVDRLDADPASTPSQRNAAIGAYWEARADRIDAEDAAEAILSALPDAAARRAALYAAGIR